MTEVAIRPMRPQDTAAAAASSRAALEALYPEDLSPEREANRAEGAAARVAHMQRTDPGGCWVADAGGEIAGCAIGIIREGLWGLSLFTMLPEYQGRGTGTRLYEPAHEYGAGQPAGIILSSSHPAAMRRYARSPGFRLLPTVGLSGAWDPRRAPAQLRCRPGDLAADADTIDAASRRARGASHMRDLPTMLARAGTTLLVIAGEGFALARDGEATLLAANDAAAAEDLLWGVFASGPRGGTVSVDFITAENQWAIQLCLEAGLAVADHAAIFVRGEPGPMAPYLANGAFL